MSDAPGLGAKIPVVVLTGFLGAGKTTLLRHLLRLPDLAGTAVIVNEFGEIGLDHDLLETSDEQVVELAGGCLCCTIRSDLTDTLRDLHQRHACGRIELRRVVVETTGLADPAPILSLLLTDAYVAHFFRLAAVVTVVDALAGLDTLARHEEARRQVAVADRLLLTKRDLAADDGAFRTALTRLNPGAPLTAVSHGAVDPAGLLEDGLYDPATRSVDVQAWLRAEAHHHSHDHDGSHHRHDVNRHGADIRAFCLRRDEPIPTAAFETFVNMLWLARGADLLRVKGIVHLLEEPDRPLVLHAVQHALHPPVSLDRWPSDDRSTRIVFVVRDVPEEKIGQMLDALVASSAA